ncbi:Thiamine phosphate synthase [Quillaja saponaria]|uniref:Thiamine phosphate synthase n=1 Tax=Quillaja saponaria TaxID=32244 RepID=A0AAD7Q0Y1_QUISA|nr:Thiamine phosphate synthase [Quillaja saponaria]
MVPLLYHHASITPLFLQPSPTRPTHLSPFHIPVRPSHSRTNSTSNNRNRFDQNEQQQYRANLQRQPRTLFPGGYKRPEIKVPTFVLQLDPEEVLNGGNALDLIDKAVSKWVGIVVLKGGESSGGRLYKAACLLKSVVRDRAYLLVAERVDIAAAAGASGVLLSDQGLPAIVARNTLLDSKSDSVVLPLVAKNVQTIDAALDASKSEGADFLIYGIGDWKHVNLEIGSVSEKVKIPIFVMFTSSGGNVSYAEASNLLNSGSCGFVISLENFGLFNDDVLHKLLNIVRKGGSKTENEHQKFSDLTLVNTDNDFYRKDGTLAGFVKLGDREKQFIETERSVLIEAIQVIKKATPLMEEVSLLVDAVSQIDEPFMLVIVGEFNSGKSTVINALLGKRYLKEGVVPTTNEITFLRYGDSDFDEQHCERHPDGQYICYLPAPILKEINIVDTPGTNVILQRQQRLTEEFVPRADLLLFVISADRPLTESEVAFLRYTQQWKKKVVFVLNKSDLYQNDHELEEAIRFIKDNTQKLLNIDSVTLYPVSARSALDAKLLASANVEKHREELSVSDSQWRVSSFYELEKFLYSFLDGSTSSGMERMKLKLETPIAIADRLITSCDTLVKQDYRYAKQDLASGE